ncbi:MAG: TolC family protein [bacterium]
MTIRNFFLPFLLTIAFAAFAQEKVAIASAAMTVDAAVQYALKNNPTIIKAQQDLVTAEIQLKTANIGNDFKVTVNGQAGVSKTDSVKGIGYGVGLQTVVNRPLWPKSQFNAPITIAEASLTVAKESLRRSKQQVAFNVRQAYYQLISTRELANVADEALKIANKQLELAIAGIKAGNKAKIDEYQATAAVADAEVNKMKAQNAVDLAGAALANQMGMLPDAVVELVTPEDPAPAPDTIDPLIADAKKNRPEAVQFTNRKAILDAGIELAKLNKKVIISGLSLITLPPFMGVKVKNVTQGPYGPASIQLGIVASLSAYNGGKNDNDVAIAENQREMLETQINQFNLGVALEVRSAWLNLKNAQQQKISAQKQLAAANESYRIAELRYVNGEGISLEVDQARLFLTSAKTSIVQATLQAQIATAQLLLAVGSEK